MRSRHAPSVKTQGRARGKPPKRTSASSGTRALTRHEVYEQRRQTRQRAAVRQAQFRRLTRMGSWAGGIAVAALVVVLIVRASTPAGDTTIAAIPGVKTYSGLAQTHVSGTVTYPQNPPVGGPHNSVWLTCGIYNAPVPNENAVHSLEHGAVWITYQPDLPASDVQHLRSLVKRRAYVILSPYNGLPMPVVASAWGVQLQLRSAYDSRIAQFIQKYEQGPQTPESGATCSGGTGAPIG